MAGMPVSSAFLGWSGLQGDRRFAFRRMDDTSGFPWLSASRLPQLILYQPDGRDDTAKEPHPTHVLTPSGDRLGLYSEELRSEISNQFGKRVELMQLKHGIFDDSPISVINTATVAHVCSLAGVAADVRRFRPNIVLDAEDQKAFLEDDWVGSTMIFGDIATGPAVHLTKRDVRCMMINLDPDTAKQDPAVQKTTVQLNENNAGLYATVVRTGQINVDDSITLIQSLTETIDTSR